ncbi:MAG: hypothetical protein AAB276_04205 [Pseudomonadota bacterium]
MDTTYTKEIFSGLAILIGTVTYFPYVLGMIKGITKPHMFSYLIWAVVCTIGAAIQIAEGAGIGSVYMAYNALLCSAIAIFSYWKGTKDIKQSDWITLLIAFAAIPLWVVTKEPIWSLFILIGIEGIAYYPTIRKSWLRPDQEVAFSWFMAGFASMFAILALENYSITTYLHPLTLMVVNIIFGIFLLARRRTLTGNKES